MTNEYAGVSVKDIPKRHREEWQHTAAKIEAQRQQREPCPDRFILLDYHVTTLAEFKAMTEAGHFDRWRVEATVRESGIAYVILSRPSDDQTRYSK